MEYAPDFEKVVDIEAQRAKIADSMLAMVAARGEQPDSPASPVDGAMSGDVPRSYTSESEEQ